MYKEKIKKALFRKIYEYYEIIAKELDIEENDDDFFNDDNYLDLVALERELINEIDELIIDTKYAPLTGLASDKIKELDFFDKMPDLSVKERKENIEKHLDHRLLILKEEIKQRIDQIKPLYLTKFLDPHINHLYNEVIRSYIYGTFEASCVLCRAITELLIKEYIKSKGYGDLLTGKNKKNKTMSLSEILEIKKLVPKEIISLYKRISKKANTILHVKDAKTGAKGALRTIDHLQKFIRKFPK